MVWGFEESVLLLLLMMAVGQGLAKRTWGVLSLQFVFGLLAFAVFSTGLLSKDVVKLSKLPEFGIFAFTVLMVHTGTLIELKRLRSSFVWIVLALFSHILVVYGISTFLHWGFDTTFSSIAIFGSGAVAAIASNALSQTNRMMSFAPWLFFMVQSMVGGLLMWLGVKKLPINQAASLKIPSSQPTKEPSKNIAWTLAVLMMAALLNKWLLVPWSPFHSSLSALMIGVLFGHLKLLRPSPLDTTETMGILMIGLVSLLALTFSQTPADHIVAYIPIVFFLSALSGSVVTLYAFILSKKRDEGFHHHLVLMSCLYLGFPFAPALYQYLSKKYQKSPVLMPDVSNYCLWGYLIIPVMAIGLLS